MFLRTIKPSPHLARFIRCYWVIEANSYNHSERILPGVDPQVLFHYRKPFVDVHDDGQSSPQPQCTISGQVLTPRSAVAESVCGAVGVVFFPHTANMLIPLSMCDIANQSYDARDVHKPFAEVESKLFDCRSPFERVRVVDEFFLSRLKYARTDSLSLLGWVVDWINREKGQVPLDTILKEIRYSERKLERLFSQSVGISPKKYCELRKLHHAIALLNTPRSLTEIAYEAGYYDQANFCKVFKRDTGLSPGQFRAEYPRCLQ